MKGKKAVLGLAACLLLLAAGCSISLAQLLETNWGVVLPGGYAERFEADTGASFHGDGVRYHVLEYADDAALREAFSWREEASPTLFYGSEREAAAALLDDPPARVGEPRVYAQDDHVHLPRIQFRTSVLL